MKLIIASNNAHKLVEIKAILGGLFDEILSMREAGIDHETVEDGATFMENAEKKAREIAQIAGCCALADDSGICVDALDGAPGIYSARFCGRHGDDAANNRLLLEKLKDKDDRRDDVLANALISETRFPQGANRAKVIFIKGMTLLNSGDASGCTAEMQQVVEKYPDSEVTPIAGMILKGVQDGRRLHGGKFDIGDLWTRRTTISTAATDSAVSDTLSVERQSPYVFILAFNPAEVTSNKLLFAIGKYNFTHFMVRSFDMRIEETDGSARLVVSGFLNYDEAAQYARRIGSDKDMTTRLQGCRRLVVSEANMPLLGTRYSYDDYDRFFIRTLAPVKVSTESLLNLPETIVVAESPDDTDSSDDSDYQQESESPDESDTFDFDEDFYR